MRFKYLKPLNLLSNNLLLGFNNFISVTITGKGEKKPKTGDQAKASSKISKFKPNEITDLTLVIAKKRRLR